ncbi:hypothetical protein CC80DRAFT_497906 [Byssothecium circinans]|uniref:PNPLA domain-containing protein n=1 Tax=Byssothecium circinans TaxID=147558 RepID=A0A6A5TDT8_9PLEO|nr:hypothetical protein CC80DRAFT_497906 [Byssothecium circinans]
MAQGLATQHGDEPNPLDTTGLCLLSLDGGGVRGLSTLYILKGLMARLNHERQSHRLPPVKPCEVFDLIGGTSTGGYVVGFVVAKISYHDSLIAIMLGRLEMDVDGCITAYSKLMKTVFGEESSWLPISRTGKVKARFDSGKLKGAVEDVISGRKVSPTDAFNDGKDRGCRTFVCATAKETARIARLRSYTLPDEGNIPATICQAALATSAATAFFDPVSIGARQFVDGALGAHNPVDEVEGEAANIWSPGTGDLKPLVKCFVSIGSGHRGKKALKDSMLGFLSKTLVGIATETEETERKFIARWAKHYDEKRFFRFNVDQGLQDVGLAKHKEQGRMEAVTDEYLRHQDLKFRVRDCVLNLEQKQKRTGMSFWLIVGEYQKRCILQNHTAANKVHYIPFPKNRYFVGRRNELAKLEQKLMVDRDCQKMSIVGLGGAGKTQVALQFAYMVKETRPEFTIFWLPAVSMGSFEQACTEVAKALGILQTTSEEKDAKELVKRHLSAVGTGQRWLLVLDNADDRDIVLGTAQSKGIVDYLPESEYGITVYTTRVQEMAESLTRSDVTEVGPMDQQEAADFLEKSLIRKDLLHDVVVTSQLLDELTYLPLAIRQATAYLNMNKTSSIAKYLRLLRNTEQDLVGLMSKEFRDDTRYKDSVNAVAMTWVVSFGQIRERDAAAADLLAFLSCIEWKAIPRSLLPSAQSEERTEEAIGMLCGYSFLARREGQSQEGEGGGEEWYDMHRLVHLATRIWASKHENVAETTEKALQHVTQVFPSNNYANRTVWRAYLPHALRILASMQSCHGKMKSKLSLLVGLCLRVDGRIREAVRWLEECHQWRRNKLKEDDPARLLSEHELAMAYEADGQVKNAVVLLEQVVAVQKKLVEEHPSRLASQHALAMAYQADGQVKKAVVLLQQVVAVKEKVLVEEHLSRLASQHELARAYQADGQVKKAVELQEQHELARAYQADGQVKKAVELQEQVVAVREKVLAEEHPSRLASQHELARAYLADGQVKKAVALLEHVVTVEKKALVEEHPNQLPSQHALAGAYLADGQVKKAVALLEWVVAVREKELAEEHPDQLASQHALARAYLADGQVKKAIELMERVVAVDDRVLPDDHPLLLVSREVLERLEGIFAEPKVQSDSA